MRSDRSASPWCEGWGHKPAGSQGHDILIGPTPWNRKSDCGFSCAGHERAEGHPSAVMLSGWPSRDSASYESIGTLRGAISWLLRGRLLGSPGQPSRVRHVMCAKRLAVPRCRLVVLGGEGVTERQYGHRIVAEQG